MISSRADRVSGSSDGATDRPVGVALSDHHRGKAEWRGHGRLRRGLVDTLVTAQFVIGGGVVGSLRRPCRVQDGDACWIHAGSVQLRGDCPRVAEECDPGDALAHRARRTLDDALFWNGCHVKFTGDVAVVPPAFIAERKHVDEIVDKLRRTLDQHL
ncbi:hypothetical protein LCGC14_0307690 [marine sediment metagenome]|uniref:Uncharacterized protein n=1 Tax=marine sediment metagenome TaxID=412755 RepID=A0A0F9U5K8_9ZZZZ